MKRVFIASSGIVTGLASTMDGNWQALMDNRTAVRKTEYFDTSAIDYKLTAAVDGLRSERSANLVQELARQALNQIPLIPQDTFTIWTGIKGNAQFIESAMQNQTLHLPKEYRVWLQKEYNLTGAGMEVNAACASSTVGIALATQKIRSGEQDSVLVCAADLASRFVQMGFSALKALTATAARPFDINRDGLVLGDGACALLLANEETCIKYGLNKLAEINGWGISNDANHITGPARDGMGLILAIKQALKMARMHAGQIQSFCAHGTATIYNDVMELTALETLVVQRTQAFKPQ